MFHNIYSLIPSLAPYTIIAGFNLIILASMIRVRMRKLRIASGRGCSPNLIEVHQQSMAVSFRLPRVRVAAVVRGRSLSFTSSSRRGDSERPGAGLNQLLGRFHRPGENHLTEGYVVTDKTESLLQEHLERTGGKVSRLFHSPHQSD